MAPLEASALKDRIRALEDLGRRIHSERPDVMQAYRSADSDEYWAWLNCFGYREYTSVRELAVPVPDPETRVYVGDPQEVGFLISGKEVYEWLMRVTRTTGRRWSEWKRILDFGCGPGRTLRYLLRHAADVECVGVDVDARAIAWNRSHFPFGSFHVTRDVPPTGLESGYFGLVYANSVFSHLSESNHLDWLNELRRITRPGGILALTIHGGLALRRCLEEAQMRRVANVSREDLAFAGEAFRAQGFAFVRQAEGHLDTDLYGVAYISRSYVEHAWGRIFQMVDYWEGAIENWQDAVILRHPE